jgi:uncharacterized membrane protein
MTTPDPTPKVRILLGVMFGGAGIAHFTKREFFDQLVPAWLARYRTPISVATGIIQLVGSVTMFIPRLRAVARWSNIGLLVPTFPAAFDQVRHPDRMRELGIPPALVIARIPAQMLVIAVTWWATRPTPCEQRSQ